MKKIMISLLMVVAATTTSFAKNDNNDVANAAKSAVENVKRAPSGTMYGVVENTKQHIVVSTPLGRYTIVKKDGGVSFMGMTEYIPIGKESRGCFTVSRKCVDKVMELYEQSSPKRPILIWAKYK